MGFLGIQNTVFSSVDFELALSACADLEMTRKNM